MVVPQTQTQQSRPPSQPQKDQEQLSDKSEGSVRSENPARIEDIFDWIDGIPLSKTTKNLARDFSDAVLMSEILKFYYPHLVRAHNYIPANGVQSKKENWNTLNRKVFTKIDMRLGPETIDQLAHSQPGVIDKLLMDFREKQMSIKVKDADIDGGSGCPELREIVDSAMPQTGRSSLTQSGGSVLGIVFEGMKSTLVLIFDVLMAILCFWRWFSVTPNRETVNFEDCQLDEAERLRDEEESQLRDSYAQVLQELRVKSDVIKTLCHKVAFLEGTMKLKDMKITSLSSQLEQAQSHAQASSDHGPGSGPGKLGLNVTSNQTKARQRKPRV